MKVATLAMLLLEVEAGALLCGMSSSRRVPGTIAMFSSLARDWY